MNTRIFLGLLLAIVVSAGISFDAAAHGRGNRGCRPRVAVRYCPPPVRYCPPPVRYCPPPPVVYYGRPRCAPPRYYAGAYAAPGHYRNNYRRCR
ncbi:MAG: hypothetical protein K9G49_00375 [Taibaiella sp.]|nr:hypothetical protein [Taibaiella sp.]